jgi:glutamine amidotransferase
MLVIVDYRMGNLGSIQNMLRRLNVPAVVSSDLHVIQAASALILPGVGAFDHGMRQLRELGIEPVLRCKVLQQKTPILGICLGMQLLTRRSEEGQLPGLGWIDAETKRFTPERFDQPRKVPHMGWNFVEPRQTHALLAGTAPFRFYFVHSYHVCCQDPANVLAVSHYGYPFTAAVCRDNILGVQFHPEKSHRFGWELLANYVRYCKHVSSQSDPVSAGGWRQAG